MDSGGFARCVKSGKRLDLTDFAVIFRLEY